MAQKKLLQVPSLWINKVGTSFVVVFDVVVFSINFIVKVTCLRIFMLIHVQFSECFFLLFLIAFK